MARLLYKASCGRRRQGDVPLSRRCLNCSRSSGLVCVSASQPGRQSPSSVTWPELQSFITDNSSGLLRATFPALRGCMKVATMYLCEPDTVVFGAVLGDWLSWLRALARTTGHNGCKCDDCRRYMQQRGEGFPGLLHPRRLPLCGPETKELKGPEGIFACKCCVLDMGPDQWLSSLFVSEHT